MGLFSRFFKKEERGIKATNGFTWSDFTSFISASNDSEETVTVEKGSRVDTYFSAVNCISQDIAKLPFNVRKKTEQGREVIKNSTYNLIHTRPNRYTSAFNFWYHIVFQMLTHGNAYAYIVKEKTKPVELIILDSDEVTCHTLDGDVYYQYNGMTFDQYELLHFKMYSFDGIVGVSPIIWNANTLGYRIRQDKYRANVIGTVPPGMLSFDQDLKEDQRKQNQDMWKAMKKDYSKVPVLSGGAKFISFMLNPDDAQALESSNLSDERILGILRVPPTIVQKYKDSAFKGPEQQDLVYLKYCITPILKVIEQECDYKLFTEANKSSNTPEYTKFNIKEMLRGDIKTQAEWYKMLRVLGLASANTILEMEDMPPLPADIGDMIVIQAGYAPLDQLRDFYNGKSSSESDEELRKMGFKLENLKEHLEKIEILNEHGS